LLQLFSLWLPKFLQNGVAYMASRRRPTDEAPTLVLNMGALTRPLVLRYNISETSRPHAHLLQLPPGVTVDMKNNSAIHQLQKFTKKFTKVSGAHCQVRNIYCISQPTEVDLPLRNSATGCALAMLAKDVQVAKGKYVKLHNSNHIF
jgi:hypothetical protein